MYHFTALVTLLAVLVYFYSSILVSRARGKFGVKLPATSGNPDFERVFRAQMNTLEWLPIFLPSLWLFAIYIGDGIAAAIGLVWVIGRILYVLGYARAVKDRGPGFAIQALATIALWIGAFGAIVWRTHKAALTPRQTPSRDRSSRRASACAIVAGGSPCCRRRIMDRQARPAGGRRAAVRGHSCRSRQPASGR
jgi:glutathione S-transferase